MKKSLVALAALAVVSAVSAQSSVTLYGRADLNVTKQNNGLGFAMTDGSANGAGSSRLGVRGVEDLGGGLKAGFVVEAQLAVDSNSTTTTFGQRNSYIDVMGGFGTVRVGRHLNNALLHTGAYSAFGTDYGLASGSNILSVEGARYNNAISYISPSMSGFSVMATTATKEGDLNASAGHNNVASPALRAKNPISVRGSYAAGPLSGSLSLTKNGTGGAELLTQLGASYDMGVAKLIAAVESDKNQVDGKKAYSLGVTAPMGAATLRATVGKDERGASADKVQVAAGADYALSKRTALYAYYAQIKTESLGAAAASTAKQVTVGIGHNF